MQGPASLVLSAALIDWRFAPDLPICCYREGVDAPPGARLRYFHACEVMMAGMSPTSMSERSTTSAAPRIEADDERVMSWLRSPTRVLAEKDRE